MKKFKFNIVDILVVIAIVVVIAAGVWYLSTAGAGDDVYTYFVVEFTGRMPGTENDIEIGGEIRDSIRNYFLGHVVDVRSQPAELLTFDNTTNRFVRSVLPGRYDVFVTVRGVGTENDSVIQANGQPVRVGQEMFLRGRGYAGIGFITELWTMERGGR